MDLIDLRSDTLTRPTPAMRRAMAEAEVGDDVFGEDPTVTRLETLAARLMGKEAALLVTSGTMGNLVCQMVHCRRGDEMILGDQAHIFFYEQGGSSAIAGIHPRTLPNRPDGSIEIGAIQGAIRADDVHFPHTRLIALENTHNRCSGAPLGAEYLAEVGDLAHRHGLKLHIDGARIFNAAAALGVDVRELAAPADSISFCLSKGLGAPLGSVVCSDAAFIQQARRARKVLGGGMRQAGVVAAAGIVALTDMVERLAEDHDNARKLALGLAEIPGIVIDPDRVRSNIVFFDLEAPLSPPRVTSDLNDEGVRMLALGPRTIRAVTHHHITARDIDRALKTVSTILRAP